MTSAAQATDLLAVMDHHGVAEAHFMGLCGGAVIAVRAAAERPRSASSLSLWHGDFSGSPGPTTSHQENLKELMAIARQSREDAEVINAALNQAATASVPPELAELVSYPYRSPELFYRYCVLTGETMNTDVSGVLGGVGQPTLVVTSEDDHTAHPGGSHAAARMLPRAVLQVEPHGDHLSAFGAGSTAASPDDRLPGRAGTGEAERSAPWLTQRSSVASGWRTPTSSWPTTGCTGSACCPG